jgi:hypothetical protein
MRAVAALDAHGTCNQRTRRVIEARIDMIGIWSADTLIAQGESVASLVLGQSARSDFGALMTKRDGAKASLVGFDLLTDCHPRNC